VLEFLENSLVHNTAGRAFQAWKAYLGALAAEHRDKLSPSTPGSRKVGAGDVDMVVTLVSTSIVTRSPFSQLFTPLALQLRCYQYSGLDPKS